MLAMINDRTCAQPVMGWRLTLAAIATAYLAMSPVAAAQSGALPSDGPYLFHQEDGSVIAKWVSEGKLEEKRFAAGAAIELPQFADLIGKHLQLRKHEPEPAVWQMPSRLLAISDVEGRYDNMRRFLTANDVVDAAGCWTFGKGHLVCVGDFVDRGNKVTETLWMLHRLAREAKAVGGRVHFVLGNHEVMMMGGDVRYTAPKYKIVAGMLGVPVPGLLGLDTELGRWLRSRNTLVRIGDMLFVHAGVSPSLSKTKIDLEAVNADIRRVVGKRPDTIKDKRLLGLAWHPHGPLWYRGYFQKYTDLSSAYFGPRPTTEQIDQILERLGAATIVVGHTKVERVTSVFGGRRVLAIDIPWTDLDKVRGILVEGERMHVVDARGKRAPLVVK